MVQEVSILCGSLLVSIYMSYLLMLHHILIQCRSTPQQREKEGTGFASPIGNVYQAVC